MIFNCMQKKRFHRPTKITQLTREADDNDRVETVVIDFDTQTRKLDVESRIFLNKIDIFQITEIFNSIWRFQRLEKI